MTPFALVWAVLVAVGVGRLAVRDPRSLATGRLVGVVPSSVPADRRIPQHRRARLLVVAAVVVAAFALGLLGVLAVAAPAITVGTRRRRQRRRERAWLDRALPQVVDQIRMAVLAGLPLRSALPEVAAVAPSAAEAVLRDCCVRLAAGARLADTLTHLGAGMGADGPRLARVLVAAEVDGGAVAAELGVLARDLRNEHRAAAEARARRLPVMLLFPLVTCVLPAFALLSVVPLVLDGLGGALGS